MVPRRRSRSMSRRRRRPATSSTTSRRPERARTRTHIRTRTHARARALCCAALRKQWRSSAGADHTAVVCAGACMARRPAAGERKRQRPALCAQARRRKVRPRAAASVCLPGGLRRASPRRGWGWVWLCRYKEHWKHLLLRYGSEYKGGGEYRAPGEPPRISLEAIVHFCTRATILPAKIDMANVLRIFQARPRPAHAAPPRPRRTTPECAARGVGHRRGH